MTNSRPLVVECIFPVKTYDVDFLGIVHNGVYIRWLEDLRLQLLAEHYPFEELIATGRSPVLERTEVNYKRALRLSDRAVGRMWLSGLRRVRWELQAEFVLEDRVAATATQVGYFVELETLRPLRIPQELYRKWEAARAPGEG